MDHPPSRQQHVSCSLARWGGPPLSF